MPSLTIPIPVPTPAADTGALAELARDIRRCTRCPLHRHRRRACPGEGPEHATIMIVGEAPGFEENAQGRPFVGKAGQLLTDLLTEAGIPRLRIRISNTARCLPPKTGGSAAPSKDTVAACLPFLEREISLVRPAILVPAGGVALQALVDPKLMITKVHGRVFFKDGRWIFPIYHPSHVLRARGDPRLKAELKTDLANLVRLGYVHSATAQRPWKLPWLVAHLFTSHETAHTPTPNSNTASWHVLDQFALPQVRSDTVTWEINGVPPMWLTASAVSELLTRWAGVPVRLTSLSKEHGAIGTILATDPRAASAVAAQAPIAFP